MLLEERRRDLRGDRTLHRRAHDLGLVLAPRHEHHPAGLEDRPHAHRDRAPGRALLAPEVAGGVAPGERVEGHHAGPRAARAARLVEADVPGAPDPEDLEVYAARGPDGVLVPAAVRIESGGGDSPVGHVGARRRDVDMVEQVRLHEAPVAARVGRLDGVVLVEVEGHHVREAEPLLAVHPDELGVESERRGAGRQAQDSRALRGLPRADKGGDVPRHGA